MQPIGRNQCKQLTIWWLFMPWELSWGFTRMAFVGKSRQEQQQWQLFLYLQVSMKIKRYLGRTVPSLSLSHHNWQLWEVPTWESMFLLLSWLFYVKGRVLVMSGGDIFWWITVVSLKIDDKAILSSVLISSHFSLHFRWFSWEHGSQYELDVARCLHLINYNREQIFKSLN